MAKEILLKKSVIAVALTLASTQVVLAQEAANATPIQKVTVTGSNIKRIDAETATPVQIMKREEIQRLGVNSVKELIDSLTAATGSLSDIGGSNSFAGGASSGSLRNLGKQSTLFLLNSRRVAPYALADYNEVFTNLDALPLDAVERVEILRNGGSAVYGSDAVAGVVNIITRSSYRGLQVSASHDRSLKNGEFNASKASITGGLGDLAVDKYNILANVEVFRRNNVNWRQVVDDINPAYGKKFSTLADRSGLVFGNRGTPSTFSYPGNLIGQGAIPGCTVKNAAGLCVYDRFSRFEVQPSADRANMLVSGKFKLSETLEGFAEVLYSKTKTEYVSAFQTYGSTSADVVWGDPSNNQQRTFVYRGIPATHPLNTSGEELEFRYRFADSGGYRRSEGAQFRTLAGLKGVIGKYDWEAAVGYMGSTSTDRSRGAISDSGFKSVIGDYTTDDPNFFNHDYKIGQPNSAATLNKLFPESGYDGKYTQSFFDYKLSGDLTNIDGRPVGLAVGGDLRHEHFDIRPTANLANGDTVGNGAVSANAGRSFGSIYSELNIPVTKNLEVNAAARADKFPGFNTHISPKLAFRLTATPAILFRGTVETGFRAPNLTESAQSTKFAFDNGVSDPKRCNQAQALASDLRARSDALPSSDPNKALFAARADIVEQNECATGVASIVRNNPNLKPETTNSYTLGIVLEPFKNVNFSLDYWNIKRKNEIGLKSTDDLLAAEDGQVDGVINRQCISPAQRGCAGKPITVDKTFLRNGPSGNELTNFGVSTGALTSTSGQFENISKTKTSGIDLASSAKFNTAYGKLDLGLSATYLIEYRAFSETLQNYGDNLAGRYGSPKVVANLTVGLETGKVSNSIRWVYNSATSLNGDYFDNNYTNSGCAAKRWTNEECGIGHYFRLDYNFKYTGIKNTTLAAFIGNVTGRRPPTDFRALDRTGGGVIPQSSEDVTGRNLRLTAEYKFY